MLSLTKACKGCERKVVIQGRRKAGALPPALPKGTKGAEVSFHNSVMGNFMIYQDRIKTNFLELSARLGNSEWFPMISVIIFEVNIVTEQKQA